MRDTFWTNTIWYILLAVTSAAVIVLIFLKTRVRKKTFAFLFAVLGFTYSIEVSLLLLFKAYTYYPMIRPGDPFFDSVLGNIFSQVSVSSSAVLICVLGLSKWWLAGFSAAYFLIDVLFVQLGIYEHYWYRSVFTLAGFFIYGLAIKYWYKRLFHGSSNWIYYITFYFCTFAISANIVGTMLKLLGVRIFQSGFYPDPARSHTAAALIYGPVMVIIMMALNKWDIRWWLKAPVFLLLLVFLWGLVQSGVIITMPGWDIVIPVFDIAVFYAFTAITDKSLKNAPLLRVPAA